MRSSLVHTTGLPALTCLWEHCALSAVRPNGCVELVRSPSLDSPSCDRATSRSPKSVASASRSGGRRGPVWSETALARAGASHPVCRTLGAGRSALAVHGEFEVGARPPSGHPGLAEMNRVSVAERSRDASGKASPVSRPRVVGPSRTVVQDQDLIDRDDRRLGWS